MDESEEEGSFQHVPVEASAATLSQLHGRLGPVGYRAPDGKFFWDLSYIFDDLIQKGMEKNTPFRMIELLRHLCDTEDWLSRQDLHCKQRQMRHCNQCQTSLLLMLFFLIAFIFGFRLLPLLLLHSCFCWLMKSNTSSIHSHAIILLWTGRPELLNVNCASTRLVLLFFVTLLDKSRTPAKDEFLLGLIKDVVWETCSQASSSAGGLQVNVGDLGVMVLEPSGQVVGFQNLVRLYHASTCKSWKLQWDSMVQSQCLHSAWSDGDTGVALLDLVVFIFTVSKVRRRQCKDTWASKSQQLLQMFTMSLVIFLESVLLDSIIDYMTQNDCYSRPLPSRRLSRCDESNTEVLSVVGFGTCHPHSYVWFLSFSDFYLAC